MAAVVTFWRFPDEEERFLRYVVKTGDIRACVAGGVPEERQLEPRPIIDLIEAQNPRRILFGPREFMDQSPITSGVFKGKRSYSRFYMEVPLLDYTRGFFRSPRELGLSNLCAEWRDVGRDAEGNDVMVDKPEGFKKWGQRIFRWVRRDTPLWHEYKNYRVTERVSAEIAKGLTIIP